MERLLIMLKSRHVNMKPNRAQRLQQKNTVSMYVSVIGDHLLSKKPDAATGREEEREPGS